MAPQAPLVRLLFWAFVVSSCLAEVGQNDFAGDGSERSSSPIRLQEGRDIIPESEEATALRVKEEGVEPEEKLGRKEEKMMDREPENEVEVEFAQQLSSLNSHEQLQGDVKLSRRPLEANKTGTPDSAEGKDDRKKKRKGKGGGVPADKVAESSKIPDHNSTVQPNNVTDPPAPEPSLSKPNSSTPIADPGGESNKTNTDNPKEPDPGQKEGGPQKTPGDSQDSGTKQKNECEDSHRCEDHAKMVACLRTSGDGTQELSLFIRNEGEDNLTAKVSVPDFLNPDQSKLQLEKGKSTTVQIVMVDSKTAKKATDSEAAKLKDIIIDTGHGDCRIEVPTQYLGNLAQQSFLKGFPYSSLITPMVGVYVLLFVFVAIAGIWLCCRYRGKRRPSDGVKYQELEMSVPGVGTPKERVGKLEEENTDGWDEVWDDDWEDTEAARSSSRLTQNLSSRGLAARRGNKDGWDSSWDD